MLSNAMHLLADYTLSTVIPRSEAMWGSTSVNRQWKISATSPTTLWVYFYIPEEIATATPRNDARSTMRGQSKPAPCETRA